MTAKLRTDSNIAAPDDFYEALIAAHRNLSREDSEALNARLILLLANQIGDHAVLIEAIAAARAAMTGHNDTSPEPGP
ncbi:MAG: DUF2783 domain-containing protein [Beijerinckiaceae bacterium]